MASLTIKMWSYTVFQVIEKEWEMICQKGNGSKFSWVEVPLAKMWTAKKKRNLNMAKCTLEYGVDYIYTKIQYRFLHVSCSS